MKLVRNAIVAGIENDLGSGSNVDITIIRKTEAKPTVIRPYDVIGLRGERYFSFMLNIFIMVTNIMSLNSFSPKVSLTNLDYI